MLSDQDSHVTKAYLFQGRILLLVCDRKEEDMREVWTKKHIVCYPLPAKERLENMPINAGYIWMIKQKIRDGDNEAEEIW